MKADYTLDRPTALTCPECGGALAPERLGTLLQYRCHIGHVLTAETMLEGKLVELEIKLGACLAMLNERIELCRQVAEHDKTDPNYKATLEAARAQARERAEALKTMLQSDWIQPARSGDGDED